MKKILFTVMVIILSSCGFKPLYGENFKTSDGQVFSEKLSKITVFIPKDYGRPGQKLKNDLEDIFYRSGRGESEYTLKIILTISKDSVGIQKDRTVTRFSIRSSSYFELLDKSGKVIYTGNNFASGSYDAATSDYGTYSLEKDIELKIAETLARDIAATVSTKLAE
jgi:hypothetical protein